MVMPKVTELPRTLEPTTGDTFTRDLDERPARSEPPGQGVSRGRGELVGQAAQQRV